MTKRRGFTLIQISILLTIASLVMVAILPSTRSNLDGNNLTITRMNAALTALRSYMAAHGNYPCPADGSLPTGSANYGVAAANPDTTNNCGGGVPAANYIDATNNIAIGIIPVRALGLSNDYALDAFGRTITYAVDTNAVICWGSRSITGKITVTDNGTAEATPFVLVSHGANGSGAWVPLPGASGTAVRLNIGTAGTDELTNAHVDGNFNPTTPLTNFVRKAQTTGFDDLVVYSSTLWPMSTLPVNYVFPAPTVTGPSGATYILNQYLSFIATYAIPVTVTGTPYISVTVGSNTRTASYASGSGTTALTFNYKLAPSDYASSGISVTSPIQLNGGSIRPSNGTCYAATFTPPSLASVLVSAPSGVTTDTNVGMSIGSCSAGSHGCIDIVDTFNAALKKWNDLAAPTYKGSAGSYGAGNTNFANPALVSTDNVLAHWYLYVPDSGNNRVVQYGNGNPSPVYAAQFGSSGTTAGLFNSPMGTAVDTSTNCTGSTACMWITDTGNNKFQKCSVNMLGGAGNCTIYGTGSYNGLALSTPTGIVADSSANGYVVDSGNNRIVKFNNTGVYQSAMGSYGSYNNSTSGAGSFNNPTGITLDTTTNCSGATACLWIADSGNNRIQRCSTDMNSAHCTVFGTGSLGGRTLSNPAGIGHDSANNIFVVDMLNSRVVVFTSAGAYSTDFGTYGIGIGNFNF
jgi:type II secretory pathway pseudopilin PulG